MRKKKAKLKPSPLIRRIPDFGSFRDKLNELGLSHWKIEIINDPFVAGQCDPNWNKIILSDVYKFYWREIFLHEVAHALTGDMKHTKRWAEKVVEIGGKAKSALLIPDKTPFTPED